MIVKMLVVNYSKIHSSWQYNFTHYIPFYHRKTILLFPAFVYFPQLLYCSTNNFYPLLVTCHIFVNQHDCIFKNPFENVFLYRHLAVIVGVFLFCILHFWDKIVLYSVPETIFCQTLFSFFLIVLYVTSHVEHPLLEIIYDIMRKLFCWWKRLLKYLLLKHKEHKFALMNPTVFGEWVFLKRFWPPVLFYLPTLRRSIGMKIIVLSTYL